LGGVGSGLAVEPNRFETSTQSSSGGGVTRPVATRRHITSLGPIDEAPIGDAPWYFKAFETIDTELHYLGSKPYGGTNSVPDEWQHQFVMSSIALRTKEYNQERTDTPDGIDFYNQSHGQKITIKAENANKIETDDASDPQLTGFIPPQLPRKRS
jgi:hypothetical protein